MALTVGGVLLGFGRNDQGALGTGDREHRREPTPIDLGLGDSDQAPCSRRAVQVSCGAGHTLVLALNRGRMDVCTSGARYTRASRAHGLLWSACVVDALGVRQGADAKRAVHLLVCAGANTWGQLGQGDRKDRSSFVRTVVHMPGVVAVQCGDEHSVAITSKGTMFVWGRGDSGQLGLGDEKAKWKPTPLIQYRVVHPEKTLRRSKRSSPILRPVVPETKRQRTAEAWHPM
jgi:E3 ubiquitin-protein ligase HERC3